MKWSIDPEFGGIPKGDLYDIEGDPDGDSDWEFLVSLFRSKYPDFPEGESYEVPDWHYNTRSLFVHLYDDRFYVPEFIDDIAHLLKLQKKETFARFECFSDQFAPKENLSGAVGDFMVFKDQVIFDPTSEETGLVSRLFPDHRAK